MKINKGKTPVPIPKLIKPGDLVTADWANSIRTSLIRLRDRRPTSGKKSANRTIETFFPTVRETKKSGEFEVNVAEGFILEWQSKSFSDSEMGNDPIIHLVKNINYSNADTFFGLFEDNEQTWLPIKDGDGVWIYFKTDKHGQIEDGTPEVRVESWESVGTTAYRPEIGLYSGRDGVYYVPISECRINEGKLEMIYYHVGDHINHHAERFSMKNRTPETEGEIHNVLDTYIPEEDTAYFNVLVQNPGDGIPIIDDADPGAESINFKRIKGDYDGEIDVSEDNGAILIKGNGATGELTWTNCGGTTVTLLAWKDGLITTNGTVGFTAGCEGSGTPTGPSTGTPP